MPASNGHRGQEKKGGKNQRCQDRSGPFLGEPFVYDKVGKLLTASNGNGTYSFDYDHDGRVTQVSEPFGQTLSYAYDGDGNQTQVVDSFGGTQTSVYDLEDRLVTREYTGEGQNLRVDFTYTANNQIATQTDYSNLAGTDLVASTSNAYDADQNVTSIVSYNSSSSVIESFEYTYDRAGNLSSEIDTQEAVTTTTSYSYDPTGQVLSAGAATYSYDAAGNRSTTMGYTTGAGNEMTSDGTYDYTYDAKGNELTKVNIATGATWTYGYNNANQMTSAVLTDSPDDKSIDYEYDVFGLLIEEEVETGCSTTVTRYAYDGWNPAKMGATGTAGYDVWAVFNSMGSLTSRQLQGDGIDQHLAYVQGGTALWYLTDHLGSTRAVINNSGTVQDSLTYDAYGNMTQSTPCAQPLYTWDGYDYDTATALYLDKARVYDSATGRWLTQDPLGFDAGDSNLYRYVNNRPTVDTDPSGMDNIITIGGSDAPVGTGQFSNGKVVAQRFVALGGMQDIRLGGSRAYISDIMAFLGESFDFSKAMVIDKNIVKQFKLDAVQNFNRGYRFGVSVQFDARLKPGADSGRYFWTQWVKETSANNNPKLNIPKSAPWRLDMNRLKVALQGFNKETRTLFMIDTPSLVAEVNGAEIVQQKNGAITFIPRAKDTTASDFISQFNAAKASYAVSFTTQLRELRPLVDDDNFSLLANAIGIASQIGTATLGPLLGGPQPSNLALDTLSSVLGQYAWGFRLTSNPFALHVNGPTWKDLS